MRTMDYIVVSSHNVVNFSHLQCAMGKQAMGNIAYNEASDCNPIVHFYFTILMCL